MYGLASTGSVPGPGLAISRSGDGGYHRANDEEVRMLFAVAVTVMEEGYLHHQVTLIPPSHTEPLSCHDI